MLLFPLAGRLNGLIDEVLSIVNGHHNTKFLHWHVHSWCHIFSSYSTTKYLIGWLGLGWVGCEVDLYQAIGFVDWQLGKRCREWFGFGQSAVIYHKLCDWFVCANLYRCYEKMCVQNLLLQYSFSQCGDVRPELPFCDEQRQSPYLVKQHICLLWAAILCIWFFMLAWCYDLMGNALFGSKLMSLNKQRMDENEHIASALLSLWLW